MSNSRLTKNFGYTASLLFLIGVIFKTYSLPTATIQMVLGTFLFMFFYLPLWLMAQLKEKKFQVFYWCQFITLQLFIAAVTFKILHWPNAGLLIFLLKLTSLFIFLPALLYRFYSKGAEEKDNSHLAIVFILFAAVFTIYSGAQVSKSVLKSINSSQSRVEITIEKLTSKSNQLFNSFYLLKDTANGEEFRKAKAIRSQTDSLCNYLKAMENVLIAALAEMPLSELDSITQRRMRNSTNVDIPNKIFLEDSGYYSAGMLKEKVNAYREFLIASVAPEQKEMIREGINLTTEDIYIEEYVDNISWEASLFFNAPANIIIGNLLQLKADIKQAESQVLTSLLNKAVTDDKTNLAAQIAELGVKYDTESKEKKLALLEKDKLLFDAKLQAKQNDIESRNRTIAIFIVCIVAFVVMLFYIIRSNMQRRKLNLELAQQKAEVTQKNNEILDSIEYAKRIQNAILPQQKIVRQHLENSFILYKPKDIVAGDFYWMESIGDLVLFAACDCTGHGVPGAMVSVVCNNALNRAVREFALTQPAAILDKTAEIVVENFSKSEDSIKDGMDISICAYHTKTKVIEWAGANNPLWLIRNGELFETKADKQSIGANEYRKAFTNHHFELNIGDTIYLFTDGFADQFGGDDGEKKLTKRRFKELLISIQAASMQEQGKALDEFISKYRNQVEQIDDILVMGVRI